MPRIVRITLAGLCFAAFAVGAAVISCVLIPRHRRRTRNLPPPEREASRRDFFLAAYHWIVGFTVARRLVAFRRPALPKDLPAGPYVLVANHPSLIDVLVLKATVPGLTCVVRADLWRRRWLRPLLSYGRDIVGPDARGAEIGRTSVLDAFVDRLREGDPVLVFPEGTRSPREGLHRFRRGAMEAAVRAGVPVVPVVLHIDPPALKHGQPWWDMPEQPIRVELEFLPRVEVNGDTDSAALARSLKRAYEAALRRAPVAPDATPQLARAGDSNMR